MAFVAAPNIIMVEWRQTMAAQQIESRIMLDNFADPDASSLEAAAIAAWDWWENDLAPNLTVDVALREVVATNMGSIDGAQFMYAPDATTTGELSGPTLPNEVAICLSFRTGNRGRSARGRMFISGLPDNSRDTPNTISTTYASAILTSGAALLTAFTGTPQFVIVSYFSEGAARPGGPVYFPVTSVVLTDRVVDSQRRRKPGVGS